jgi:integrase
MARLSAKLTNLQVRMAPPGVHADGGGLYLQVREGATGPDGKKCCTRSWIYRYTVNDRQTWLGLGSYPTVSLATAREKATDARRLRADGIDPLAQKRVERAALSQERAKPLPFVECAAAYIESHQSAWRSTRHAQQWVRSLATHVHPIIGKVLVTDIDTALVMRVLEPIWSTKTETAARIRGRIELILDWATVLGYRSGANPARWRGHLDHLLPARAKVRPVRHHPALSYRDLPPFIVALRQREAVAAKCMEFLIAAACRASEAREARWDEIDLPNQTWTIPRERTKSFHEHRIPLSNAAMAVLAQMPRDGDLVFGRLSHAALQILLLRMGRRDISIHGFRSTFRVWAAERTNFPREVAEMALAHAIANRTEAAYARTDLLEQRRRLMNAWGGFLGKIPTEQGNAVVSLRVV